MSGWMQFPIENYRQRSTAEACPTCRAEAGFCCVEYTGQDFFYAGTAHPVQPHMVPVEASKTEVTP